jgi:ABC-type transporter Mla subunit MlaD
MATHEHFHVDVSDVSQHFDELVKEGQDVISRIDTLKNRFEAVGAEVDKANAAVQHGKDTIDQGIKNLHQAVTQAMSHLQSQVQENVAEFQTFMSGVDASSHKFADLKNTFDHSHETLTGALDKSHDHVRQLTDQTKSTAHTTQSHTHDAANQVTHLGDTLAQHFESSTHAAVSKLSDHLDHVRGEAETFTHQTQAHVEQIEHDVDTTVTEHVETPVHQAAGQGVQLMHQIASTDVDSIIHQVMDAGRTALEKEVKTIIHDLIAKVAAELDKVSEDIEKAGHDNSGARAIIQPIFDLIEGHIDTAGSSVQHGAGVASGAGCDYHNP